MSEFTWSRCTQYNMETIFRSESLSTLMKFIWATHSSGSKNQHECDKLWLPWWFRPKKETKKERKLTKNYVRKLALMYWYASIVFFIIHGTNILRHDILKKKSIENQIETTNIYAVDYVTEIKRLSNYWTTISCRELVCVSICAKAIHNIAHSRTP